MVILRLSWRLMRGGGRAGMTRLLLMVIGVGAAVACVSVAATLPAVVSARAERAADRLPVYAATQQELSRGVFRMDQISDSVDDRPWLHLLVAPEVGAPLPPGVATWPAPGQTLASPALIDAARSSPLLAGRLGPIAGAIGPAGLQGPDESVSYTVVTNDEKLPSAGLGFGRPVRDVPDRQSASSLAIELILLIGGPAVLFLLTSSRLSAATRAKRLAALRLVGLSNRQLLAVAGWEGAVAGALGAALGLGVYSLVAPFLGRSGIIGIGWYAGDSSIGFSAAVIVVLLVAALSAWAGTIGLRRVLTSAAEVRKGEGESSGSWWPLIPFFGGLTVLLGFAVLTIGRAHSQFTDNALFTVLAGVFLAGAGLLLSIGPACRGVAALIGERANGVALRLGARRIQYESSSLVRLVTGLVLLVVIAGLGQALLRGSYLAAGTQTKVQTQQVDLFKLSASQRAQVVPSPALARVVTVQNDVPGSGSSADPASPVAGSPGAAGEPTSTDPAANSAQGAPSGESAQGPSVQGPSSPAFSTCADLRAVYQQAIPSCADGQLYQLEDADPRIPRTNVAPGTPMQIVSADGQITRLRAPAQVLEIKGLYDSPIALAGSVVRTSVQPPPGGWPSGTTVIFAIGPTDDDLMALKASLEKVSPGVLYGVGSRNISAVEIYRVHRGAVNLGLFVGFFLAVLTFSVSAIDRAVERRRSVATLVVLGVPPRTLRASQMVQLAIPLAIGLGFAAIVTSLAGHDFLVISDPLFGPTWRVLGWTVSMAVIAGLAGLLTARIVPGLRPRAEDLRRE